MNTTCKAIIWQQFGAAIDMLENAVIACPAKVWGDRPGPQEFWYLTFHTLFFLDFYLSDKREGFGPPAPFGLEEFDPAGVLPPRVYSKDELLTYLTYGRKKCRSAIAGLTQERATSESGGLRPGLTYLELHLYNMRHVQHHAAQLNLILRQTIDSAPRWVSKTAHKLSVE